MIIGKMGVGMLTGESLCIKYSEHTYNILVQCTNKIL